MIANHKEGSRKDAKGAKVGVVALVVNLELGLRVGNPRYNLRGCVRGG